MRDVPYRIYDDVYHKKVFSYQKQAGALRQLRLGNSIPNALCIKQIHSNTQQRKLHLYIKNEWAMFGAPELRTSYEFSTAVEHTFARRQAHNPGAPK